MARAKQKVRRRTSKRSRAAAPAVATTAARAPTKTLPETPLPRRAMRERIEVRDEQRLLTRELSDWESYQD